jgi:hypothetical protein
MDELERIVDILSKQDPATLTDDSLTKEEWAVLTEHYNEMAIKVANLKSIKQWVTLTNSLPHGILNPEEKVEMIKLVLSRVPKDLR